MSEKTSGIHGTCAFTVQVDAVVDHDIFARKRLLYYETSPAAKSEEKQMLSQATVKHVTVAR